MFKFAVSLASLSNSKYLGEKSYQYFIIFVVVTDTEPPNVIFCESPPVFFLSNFSEIKWEEPIFTDNLDGPINVEKSHTFGEFPVGITPVTYTAWDVSRNSAECVLNITALSMRQCFNITVCNLVSFHFILFYFTNFFFN